MVWGGQGAGRWKSGKLARASRDAKICLLGTNAGSPVIRPAAGMVVDAVVAAVRRILQTPEVVPVVLSALKRVRCPGPMPSRPS